MIMRKLTKELIDSIEPGLEINLGNSFNVYKYLDEITVVLFHLDDTDTEILQILPNGDELIYIVLNDGLFDKYEEDLNLIMY